MLRSRAASPDISPIFVAGWLRGCRYKARDGKSAQAYLTVLFYSFRESSKLLKQRPNPGKLVSTKNCHLTLVLGIGNKLLRDEGAGIHVVEYLREHYPALPGVVYLDGGTLSFTLAGAIEDADDLIVVDAAELRATPGTVRAYLGTDMDRFLGGPRRSVHEVSLVDLMNIARLTDSLPSNRALIGVQPAELGWGDGPSGHVAAALPKAADAALDLMRTWRVDLEAGR